MLPASAFFNASKSLKTSDSGTTAGITCSFSRRSRWATETPTTSTRTPAAIQSRQRVFQRIDACLVHVGDAVHAENQEPALGCRLTGDVEELAGETEEERPIDVLDEELVADRVRDGQFIRPRFIGDRRERRLPFRDVAYLLHEDERRHDEAGGHRDDQIGEHGQHEDEEHQERIRPWHLEEMADAAVVDDANPDGNEQTRKDGAGNMLDEARQAEQHGGEKQAMDHTR